MDPDFLVCSETLSAFVDSNIMDGCVKPVSEPVMLVRKNFSAVLPRTAASADVNGEESVFFVSGALISPDYFVCHALEGAEVDYVGLLKKINESGSDFSGVFCLIRIGESSFEIYTDELGQFPLFSYIHGKDWVVASDPWAIINLLGRKGIAVERDYEAVCMAMIYGTTFGTSTGFKGIALVRGNHLWLHGYAKLKTNSESYLKNIFVDVDYHTYLAETAEVLAGGIGTAVRTLKSASYNCISDLTGGMDSRLTAAMLIAAGCDKEVGMFSLGKKPKPDRMVADYLIEKHGWKPGVLVRSGNEPVENYHELYHKAVFRTFGMKLSEFPDLADTRVDKMARFTGYYGELSRIFYDEYIGLSDKQIVQSFIGGMAAHNSFLRNSVISSFVKRLSKTLKRYKKCGLNGTARLKALYLENRSKTHFGIAAHTADRSRLGVHPLNSSRLIRLSHALPDRECSSNKVCFDLICKMAGRDFALEPMAGKFWSKSLVSGLVDARRYKNSIIKSRSALQSADSGTKTVVVRRGGAAPKRADPGFASRMSSQGKQYYWALLPDSLESIKENIPGLSSDDELFDFLDRESVGSALEKSLDAFDSNVLAKNTLRLAALLIWLQRKEMASRIVNVVDANDFLINGIRDLV